MSRQSGFTLIETLITVSIVAILMAVAIPSFTDSISRRRVEGVANELASDLQFARTQAASKNTGMQLVVASASSYSVRDTQTTPSIYKTTALPSNCSLSGTVAGAAVTLPMTISFDAQRGNVTVASVANDSGLTVTCTQTSVTLRVATSIVGAVTICSPNSSFPGYPAC